MNTQQQPIETWTREQCEEYLIKYPKSLNSDAVRKRYQSLQPQKTEERGGQQAGAKKKPAQQSSFAPKIEPKRIPDSKARQIYTPKPVYGMGQKQQPNQVWEAIKSVGRVVLIVIGVGFIVLALISGQWAYSTIAPVAYLVSRLMKD